MKVQFRETTWSKQNSREGAVAEEAGSDAVSVPIREAELRTPAFVAARHSRALPADLRQIDPQKLGRSVLKRSLFSLVGSRTGAAGATPKGVALAGHRCRPVRPSRFAPGAGVTSACRAAGQRDRRKTDEKLGFSPTQTSNQTPPSRRAKDHQ